MPIIKIKKNGRVGYKYGKHGKEYFGAGAHAKALKQMRGIFYSKSKSKK